MTEEQVKEKLEKGIKTYDDWWNKHKIGTRISLITFILLYAGSVIYALTHSDKDIKYFEVILGTTSETAFWSFAVVTVGANTLVKLADVWFKVKTKLTK